MSRMNIFVDLNIPEAMELADYTGIQHDFKSAKNFIELLQADYTMETQARGINDALTTAILIRYCRPFEGGIRSLSWREDALNILTETERAMHEHIRAIRSKHIAHSVNDYEENRPHARYWTDSVEQEGFSSIGCNHIRVIGLGSSDIALLSSVMDKFIQFSKTKLSKKSAVFSALSKTCLFKKFWRWAIDLLRVLILRA